VYSLLVPSAASITRWPGLEGFEVYPTDVNKDAFQDADAFLLRGDISPMEGWKTGLFFLYQHMDGFDMVNDKRTLETAYEIKNFGKDKYDLYTVGIDGKYTMKTDFGEAFANYYDFIYQGGSIDRPGDEDVSAYFLRMPIWVSMPGNFV